jgi:hypothetical protein
VSLHNEGDVPAAAVAVRGELLGRLDRAEIAEGVPAGMTRSVQLYYPFEYPRPGVHPLVLLLEYSTEGDAPQKLTQPAFILVALGSQPPPAVTLTVPELGLDSIGTLQVGLESVDGIAHRMRVRVETPLALRVLDPPAEIEVPAAGQVQLPFRIQRGSAARGSQQGILVLAETAEGALAQTTVVTGVVQVLGNTSWLLRLRWVILTVAAALLLAAAVVEVRRWLGSASSEPA